MKKFISALSSFVIAATAMGGAMVYAQTNDSVPATAKTIVDIQSGGKNTVNIASGTSAVTEVPVAIYVPQSNGIHSLNLRLMVNDGEPGKGSCVDKQGNEYSYATTPDAACLKATYGNYGFKIKGTVDDNAAAWKKQKICFDSGYITGKTKQAGYYNTGTMSNFIPATWVVSYMGTEAVNKKTNMDSYSAWVAAESPAYADYTPVTKWTKDEAWAYKNALIEFTVEVPGGLADGDYVIDVTKAGVETYNSGMSSLFDDNNKLKEESAWGTIVSKATGIEGEKDVEREFETVPLHIVVGEVPDQPKETTPAPAQETDAPAKQTTPAPAPAQTTPAQQGQEVGAKDIVYDLVLAGQKATVGETFEGNNTGTVEPGAEFKVEWRVKHDPGTAGLQLVLDFADFVKAGGSFVSADDGDSPYMAATQINDENAAKGEVKYAFGQATEEDPVEDDVLCVFTFKAPTKEGTYTITNTGKLKAIPKEQGEEYSTLFHGLTITVGDAPAETTPAPAQQTTPAPAQQTTPAPAQQTTPAPAQQTTPAPAQQTTPAPVTPGTKLIGDVNCNGEVQINDVVLLNRYLAGTKTLEGQGLINADANVDKKVDGDDSTEIKEFLARLNLKTTKVGTAG